MECLHARLVFRRWHAATPGMSHEHAQRLQGEAEAKEVAEQEQAPETAAAPSAIENPLFEESTSKVSAESTAILCLLC